jgi:hypothetical protein
MRKLRLFLGCCLALGTLAPTTVTAQVMSLSDDIILLSKGTQIQEQCRASHHLDGGIASTTSTLETNPNSNSFIQQVSAESPAVEPPQPTSMARPDALIEDIDASTSAKVPDDANDGCVIISQGDSGLQGSSRPNRGCWWVPRGAIPFLGPRASSDQKYLGTGEPSLAPNWRSQPFSIAMFAGVTAGGALIPGHVHQQPSFYGGLNVGWDYDRFWGIEKRLGFGTMALTNGDHQPIPQSGLSVTGEYRLMYYPLGDSRLRPFVTAGVGWSDFYFNDDRGARHLDTTGMIPFGIGLKYLHTERIAVRVDLIDEINFGTGPLSTFQYVALTAGLEIRYGKRLLHMPWHHKDGS